MIKTYQAIQFREYHLAIVVGKKKVKVSFTGGSQFPIPVNGKYMTGDKNIQRVLDKHPLNGVQFELIAETKPVVKPSKAREGFKNVKNITTLQDAKEWLASELEDVDLETLNNKERILLCAESNKINFVDLKL